MESLVYVLTILLQNLKIQKKKTGKRAKNDIHREHERCQKCARDHVMNVREESHDYICVIYAVRMHVPPASLIFFSAEALKNLALTIIGSLGRWPLPRTLKKPDLPTSTTAAFPATGVR